MTRSHTLLVLAATALTGSGVLGLSLGFTAAQPEALPRIEAATEPTSAARSFELDVVHSSVIFSIRHADVANFYGRFNAINGDIAWDPDNPAGSSIQLSIPAASVDTGNDRRDAHLRNPDFFNAPEYPSIDFASSSIEKRGDAYHVTGELTMVGVTRPLQIELRQTGSTTHRSGRTLIGLESIFTIKRSDFNMNYGLDGGALGDEVKLIFSLEAIEASS